MFVRCGLVALDARKVVQDLLRSGKKKSAPGGLKTIWCPGLDSNQHDRRSPPPQDGMSTNFTTRAFVTWLGFEPRAHTLKVYCSTS
jgi:hypothetical protein